MYLLYVLWTAAVFGFYLFHNPPGSVSLFYSAAGFLLTAAAALGSGRAGLKVFRVRPSTFLEEFSFSLALGLGILYAVSLALAASGFLSATGARLAALLLAAASFRSLYGWFSSAAAKFRLYSANRFSVLGALFLIVLTAGLAGALITALTPPVEWYPLSVSLASGALYRFSGYAALSGIYDLNLPPAMFMLHAFGYFAGGIPAARLITFLFLSVFACAIYSITRKFFHRKIALFAVCASLSVPAVIIFYLTDHPFIASGLFAFMAFYAYLCWAGPLSRGEGFSGSWLALSGLFTGLSLSSGYYSMFTALILLIMVSIKVLAIEKGAGIQALVNTLAVFLVPFIGALTPMLIRNIFISGTPLFPFFAGKEGFSLPLPGMGHIWNLPFSGEVDIGSFFYFGPVFPVLLPGIILVREFGRTIRVFFTYTLLYLGFFILTGRHLASLYALFPFLGIISAYTAVNLFGQKKYLYQFTVGSFLLALAVNFYTVWPRLNINDGVSITLGHMPREEFLHENLDPYGAYRFINTETPQGSRILVSGDERTLYIEREVLVSGRFSLDPLAEYLERGGGAPETIELLRGDGITHILLNLSAPYSGKYASEAGRLIEKLNKVFTGGGFAVYEL